MVSKYNKYLDKLNFKSFNKMQEEAFYYFNDKRNLIISSETGTGKTYAYLIPLYDYLINNNKTAIIILPTNSLIDQVYKMLIPIISDAKKVNIYKTGDIKKLTNKESNIIITTLDNLDNLLNKGFNLSLASHIIYDEADMLFEGDFLEKTLYFLNYFKKIKQILVSATLSPNIAKIIKDNSKSFINIKGGMRFSGQNHFLINTETNNRLLKLRNLVSIINPYLAFIFVSKKEDIPIIYKELLPLKKKIISISGDDKVSIRKQKLRDIKDLKYQFVITSDLLSRGIDLSISDIINYDIPNRLDYFIHRSGRTARYDKSGNIYTFYTQKDRKKIDNLVKKGIKFKKIRIKEGSLEEIKKRKPTFDIFQKALKKVRKPKRVSPNYRKKNKKKIKKELQLLRKEHYKKKGWKKDE